VHHTVFFPHPVLIVQIYRWVTVRYRQLQHIAQHYPQALVVTGLICRFGPQENAVFVACKSKLQFG
jgi:hypothetical protein